MNPQKAIPIAITSCLIISSIAYICKSRCCYHFVRMSVNHLYMRSGDKFSLFCIICVCARGCVRGCVRVGACMCVCAHVIFGVF